LWSNDAQFARPNLLVNSGLQCFGYWDYTLFTIYYLLSTIKTMEYKHNPPSLSELRQYRKPIKNDRVQHLKSLSLGERFAVYLHRQVGSLGFFLLLIVWTVIWLGWNMFGPAIYRFDPGPAFVIWLFASNIIQLILLPVIMVGQNIEGRAAEWRAQMDFEVNQKAEHEIEIVIAHLENQNELLLELMRKTERR